MFSFLGYCRPPGEHGEKVGESVRIALRRSAASARVEVSVAGDLRSTTATHSFVHCAKSRSQPCLCSFYRSTDHSTSFHHRPVDEETKPELPLREASGSLSIDLNLDHEPWKLLSSTPSRETSLPSLPTSLTVNCELLTTLICNGAFQRRSINEAPNPRGRPSDGSRGGRAARGVSSWSLFRCLCFSVAAWRKEAPDGGGFG